MARIIEVEKLSHRFTNGTLALNQVSLCFQEGEFTIVAGANGSGKTTLFRHIVGLLPPESGNVRVSGCSVSDDPMKAREQVGLVFQDADSQIIGETVYEEVAFGPENLQLPRHKIDVLVQRALAEVDLAGYEEKSPHNLSGGEKRRLAIAGILAMSPRAILMDEPFANLDYTATCLILKQLVKLHNAGCSIIIATHDLEKAAIHADRIVIMEHGCVVRDGRPEEVVKGIEHFGVRSPCSVRYGMGLLPWEA
jgi:biotin transport system ATP-binding protein